LLAVTGGKERMKFYLKRDRPDYSPVPDLNDFIAELHKNKTARYNELLVQYPIPLRPGVRRLLEEARSEGLRLAIATTTTPLNVKTLLEHSLSSDAMEWFDVIAAGDVVPAKKPAPDVYDYALKELGLTAEQCIAFEDSGNGIRSAKAANLRTIITINDYTKDEDFTSAELVLNHFGEPDNPFTVLAGDVGDARYMDISLLRHLA
jgi:HAD superfamily hydrolase (TIGR01509 family)